MSAICNDTPHYTKDARDDMHFKILREKVNRVLEELPASRITAMYWKAVLLPIIYAGIYALALLQSSYGLFCLCYIFLGIMLVILFLNPFMRRRIIIFSVAAKTTSGI